MKEPITRRQMVISSATALAGEAILFGRRRLAYAQDGNASDHLREPSAPNTGQTHVDQSPRSPGEPGRDFTPVVTPNGTTLPWKVVNDVKVFHLIAEPIRHEIAPGLVVDAWGYNGRTPGPTIEVVEGDRVRIYVTNRLPEPTSVHWHGVLLPNGMDGVSGLTQKEIDPGETFVYEFTLRQHGTHMYHPHFDEMTQMALGMMGLFIIHPRNPNGPRPDRDFAFMLSEWFIQPGTSRPKPNAMTDFNIFTLNSKAFPATEPLVVKLGQRVRVRLANLSATTLSTSTATKSRSPRPMAGLLPTPHSSPRRQSSFPSEARATSSSSLTSRGIGPCTAT